MVRFEDGDKDAMDLDIDSLIEAGRVRTDELKANHKREREIDRERGRDRKREREGGCV